MPIFAIFGQFLAIFGLFWPFLDREHQKQCNCNLLGATGPTNYINMVSNGYLEIWSVSDPKTNSGAKQDPKLTWGGQNWSFCTLCSPTNLFYTKNVNSEMVTSKSYFLAWNRPSSNWSNWRAATRWVIWHHEGYNGNRVSPMNTHMIKKILPRKFLALLTACRHL